MRSLASSLSRPAERLRDYLRLVRLMIGDTRDQVYAIRATLEGQLAHLLAQTSAQGAQIAHLRAELGAHVAQVAAASAARAGEHQAHHAQLVELLRLMYAR